MRDVRFTETSGLAPLLGEVREGRTYAVADTEESEAKAAALGAERAALLACLLGDAEELVGGDAWEEATGPSLERGSREGRESACLPAFPQVDSGISRGTVGRQSMRVRARSTLYSLRPALDARGRRRRFHRRVLPALVLRG